MSSSIAWNKVLKKIQAFKENSIEPANTENFDRWTQVSLEII